MRDAAEEARAASRRAGGALRAGEESAPGVADPSCAVVATARAVFVVIALALAVLLFDLSGGLERAAGRPLGVTLRLAGGWMTVAIVLTRLSLARGFAGRSPAHLAASATAAPLVLFAWTQLSSGGYSHEEASAGAAARCFAVTLASAIVPFAGAMTLRRAVSAARAGPLGATAGAACGAWAGVVAALGCARTSAVHALSGHASPVALLVVAGALAGARLLSTPAR